MLGSASRLWTYSVTLVIQRAYGTFMLKTFSLHVVALSLTACDLRVFFPGCHGNKILAKIGYNFAYMRDISEILASNRGFWGMAI